MEVVNVDTLVLCNTLTHMDTHTHTHTHTHTRTWLHTNTHTDQSKGCMVAFAPLKQSKSSAGKFSWGRKDSPDLEKDWGTQSLTTISILLSETRTVGPVYTRYTH